MEVSDSLKADVVETKENSCYCGVIAFVESVLGVAQVRTLALAKSNQGQEDCAVHLHPPKSCWLFSLEGYLRGLVRDERLPYYRAAHGFERVSQATACAKKTPLTARPLPDMSANSESNKLIPCCCALVAVPIEIGCCWVSHMSA